MQQANVSASKEFKEEAVNKVTYLKTEQLVQDTYYFKPDRSLTITGTRAGTRYFSSTRARGPTSSITARKRRRTLSPA